MKLGLVRSRLMPVLYVWWVISSATAGERWRSLLENNPFAPDAPPQHVQPPPPSLELRGVLVEGRTTWFNIYNSETKESAWVQKGDQLANYLVKDYDPVHEALVLDDQKRPVSVALKSSKIQSLAGSGRNPGALASLAMPPVSSPPPAVAPTLAASESQRLEQVAEQIRQRREERKKQGPGSRT